MKKIIALALLAVVGCSKPASPALPPTAGDFVTNKDGVGTARAFGIDFSVRVNSRGAATDAAIEANFVDPTKSAARKRFTLGDDVTIQLDGVDESTARFTFNDQDMGILKVGDKVVIDEKRNVEVNGTPRPPKLTE